MTVNIEDEPLTNIVTGIREYFREKLAMGQISTLQDLEKFNRFQNKTLLEYSGLTRRDSLELRIEKLKRNGVLEQIGKRGTKATYYRLKNPDFGRILKSYHLKMITEYDEESISYDLFRDQTRTNLISGTYGLNIAFITDFLRFSHEQLKLETVPSPDAFRAQLQMITERLSASVWELYQLKFTIFFQYLHIMVSVESIHITDPEVRGFIITIIPHFERMLLDERYDIEAFLEQNLPRDTLRAFGSLTEEQRHTILTFYRDMILSRLKPFLPMRILFFGEVKVPELKLKHLDTEYPLQALQNLCDRLKEPQTDSDVVE